MSMLFPKSKLTLRLIPKTTMACYIGGYSALNLPMHDTPGDWHQPDYIYSPEDHPLELSLFGEGIENGNINPVYGDYGIIESAEDMKGWGFKVDFPQVFRSNHFRTILDMLYFDLMTYVIDSRLPFITQGATADFLNTDEQKQIVLEKAMELMPYLPSDRVFLLNKWIDIEMKYED